jgi:hypothetical protein
VTPPIPHEKKPIPRELKQHTPDVPSTHKVEQNPHSRQEHIGASVSVVDLGWNDLWRLPLTGKEIEMLEQSDLDIIAAQMRQKYLETTFWHDLRRYTGDILRGKGIVPEPFHILDDETRARLPTINDSDPSDIDALAPVKFYLADDEQAWYATAFDGQDTFMGLIVNQEIQLGSFSLTDLHRKRGRLGISVGRDPDYIPQTLRQLYEQHGLHPIDNES